MIAQPIFSSSLKAVFATAFFVSPALAQPEAPPAQTVSETCGAIPPFDDAAVQPFLEMVLTPGSKVDPAKIPPDTRAKLLALQKRAAPRAIFLGDSITEYWRQGDPAFFSGTVRNRRISSQATAQILLRFYPNVVALNPDVVHIMAGINDVAGSLGPVSDDTIIANITAMIDIAKANGINVILASIPPARFMSWKPGLTPAPGSWRSMRGLTSSRTRGKQLTSITTPACVTARAAFKRRWRMTASTPIATVMP